MSVVTERADTIARFLRDDTVQDVFKELKDRAYQQFLRATNDDERQTAHASAKALDQLEVAFQAAIDDGNRERMDEENAERRLATR